MNPLKMILTVMHEHMTADNDEIYVEMLRLVQHCMDETDAKDYETDTDGDSIIRDLAEAVSDYEALQREDDDENLEDDDEELDRSEEDLDDDNEPVAKVEEPTSN
jgi:hypothetical protein